MLYYIMKILNDLYIPIVVLAVVAISYSAYLSMDIRSRSKTPIKHEQNAFPGVPQGALLGSKIEPFW